jgi:hypothetical protein
MAHWAEIDENNIVIQVTVGDNDDPNGDEGYQWLIDNLGGTWLKTSYNTFGGVHAASGTPFRKNFASVGFTYDEVRDAFIPPKPFESWILHEETCQWDSPVPYPNDDKAYKWDEPTLSWIEVPLLEEND